MADPLLDKEFLRELDKYNQREIYAKVIGLDFNENPIEELIGVITGGSINVDGNSAIRRTCSLNMICNDEININDYYWGLKSKVKIFIGLQNFINPSYPEVIWFPQGIYVLTSFSTNHSVNNYTISLQGKDKMCLLNGDLGGTVNSLTWDFGKIEQVDDDGNVQKTDLLLKDIIRDAVHEFAQEKYSNIVINDLDIKGLELLEYRGSQPIYLRKNNITQEYDAIRLSQLGTDGWEEYNYGDSIGYRMTDLTYAGDLICKAGDSITSMLDKIRDMLGEYEYFYDIDGRFVFQRKKTYVRNAWNAIVTNNEDNTDDKDNTYVDSLINATPLAYNFENTPLLTVVANAPNYANLRNDFSVWGERKGVNGATINIHYRYAIDKKPFYYKSWNERFQKITDVREIEQNEIDIYCREKGNTEKRPYEWKEGVAPKSTDNNYYYKRIIGKTYITDDGINYLRQAYGIELAEGSYDLVDWRELIYQMAIDYRQHQLEDDFQSVLARNNTITIDSNSEDQKEISVYPSGETGYEQYYVDIEGFWRQLYDPEPADTYSYCNYAVVENSTLKAQESLIRLKWEEANTYFKKIQDYLANYPIGSLGSKENFTIEFDKDTNDITNYSFLCKKYSDLIDAKEEEMHSATTEEDQAAIDEWYASKESAWENLFDTINVYDDAKNKETELAAELISIQNKIKKEENQEESKIKKFFMKNYFRAYDSRVDEGVKNTELYIQEDENDIGFKYYGNYMESLNLSSIMEILMGNEINKFYIASKLLEEKSEDADLYGEYDVADVKEKNKIEYAKDGITLKDLMLKVTTGENENNLISFKDYFNNLAINNREDGNFYIKDSIYLQEAPSYPKKYSYIFKYTPFGEKILAGRVGDRDEYEYTKSEIQYYQKNESIYQGSQLGDYWNISIDNAPETINFWFDFLDSDGELQQFSVKAIGDRSKAVNDNKVKAIFYRETPTVIFTTSNNGEFMSGYTMMRMTEQVMSMFTLSAQGKTAADVIDEFLFNNSYCSEAITLTSVPIYYLQPNTRIYVRDEESNIAGDYIMNKFTIQLTANGTMSINATRVPQNLY